MNARRSMCWRRSVSVAVQPVPLGAGWEGGWRCGEVVLSMVADHARAAWSAKVRETLFVDGVRLARPVRSTDGRYVVAGLAGGHVRRGHTGAAP